MPAGLTVVLADGTTFHAVESSYEGFHDDPLSWAGARAKFDSLTTRFADEALRDEIAGIVENLGNESVARLTEALARVGARELV